MILRLDSAGDLVYDVGVEKPILGKGFYFMAISPLREREVSPQNSFYLWADFCMRGNHD